MCLAVCYIPQEQFPDAEIETQSNYSSSVTVTAGMKTNHDHVVVRVSQRDLYRKYRWPAAPEMTEKLKAFKEAFREEMES